jgi:hypothetical protein
MGLTTEEQKAWLDQVIETTIDPAREIVEPHHHMWCSVAGGSLPPTNSIRQTGGASV